MVKEIYTRTPNDINYQLNIETTDDIESILGQIRMILGTKPLSVLGSPGFGVDLNQYIFLFGVNVDDIKKNIVRHFTEYMIYDKVRYKVDVDINYGKEYNGEGDYAVIDIIINQNKCMGVMVTQF